MNRADLQTPWADREEMRQLLRVAAESGPRDLLLLSLLGLNGLRVSEAIRAECADLGTSGGHPTLRVVRKGAKKGLIPLAPAVAKAVEDVLEGRSQGPLVPRLDRSGGIATPIAGISRQAAYDRVQALAKRAGVNPELSPHSLRRSFVTLALQDGTPLHRVQLAVGHASPVTTMIYNYDGDLEGNPTFDLAESLLGVKG